MNQKNPRVINARMHPKALSRIPRMWNATVPNIINELFQNARRSHASRIDVTIHRQPHLNAYEVTVQDDGHGINDPQLLLSFGENGWTNGLSEREDAAGMGFAALAPIGCTVHSRSQSAGPEWTLTLEPDHFTGNADAIVHDVPEEDALLAQPGTHVRFLIQNTKPSDIDRAVANAARYLPVPVWRHSTPNAQPGDGRQPSLPFLDAAVYTTDYQGITLGVFKRAVYPYNSDNLNFHGLTLHIELPAVTNVAGVTWYTSADVHDCPHLELVLPARKEAVENDFLSRLRTAARTAVYQAMSQDPDAKPCFADWKAARELGIHIPEPPAELKPWRPKTADWSRPGHTRDKAVPVDPQHHLLAPPDNDLNTPEAQTLQQAARRAKQEAFLLQPKPELEGFAWYDALNRMTNLHTSAVINSQTYDLTKDEPPRTTPLPKADPIHVHFIRQHGDQTTAESWPSNAAFFFAEDYPVTPDDIPVVLAKDHDFSVNDLQDLLVAAYFSPSDDPDADSTYTQEEDFRNEAATTAVHLLEGPAAAVHHAFVSLANRYLRPLLGKNEKAVLTLSRNRTHLEMTTTEDDDPKAETSPSCHS